MANSCAAFGTLTVSIGFIDSINGVFESKQQCLLKRNLNRAGRSIAIAGGLHTATVA